MAMVPEIARGRRNSAFYRIGVRRNFAVGITLLVILFGALLLSFHPVRYTAAATLALAPQQSLKEILPIIQSDEFLIPLIEKHGFDRRAAFNPSLHPQDTIYSRLLSLFDPTRNAPLNAQIAEKIRQDTSIVITPEGTLQIAFTSVTQDLAAKVADALTEGLIADPRLKGKIQIRQKALMPESFSEPDIAGTLQSAGLLGLFSGTALAYLLALIQTKKQEAADVR